MEGVAPTAYRAERFPIAAGVIEGACRHPQPHGTGAGRVASQTFTTLGISSDNAAALGPRRVMSWI